MLHVFKLAHIAVSECHYANVSEMNQDHKTDYLHRGKLILDIEHQEYYYGYI